MSKQAKNSNAVAASVSSNWDENPLVEWISSNRQILLWGVAAAFVGLILAYRLISANLLNTEGDFFRAQALFTQFQEKTTVDNTALNELEAIIRRHPELQAKYDGPLAQTLLIDGDVSK